MRVDRYKGAVTTFAVVWIEIEYDNYVGRIDVVTTFAVVWIEILRVCTNAYRERHHLRGGVD